MALIAIAGINSLRSSKGGVLGSGDERGKALAQFFPVLGMPSWTWAVGTVLIVILGGLAAALPCAQASRLKIVDALRKN